MERRPGRFEFEVKDRAGKWHKMTNVAIEDEAELKKFAQNTADGWIKK